MHCLPVVLDFWTAFATYQLQKLSTSILSLSQSSQRRALSTHIQILSLVPLEPYFCRFITFQNLSHGLPTRVVDVFYPRHRLVETKWPRTPFGLTLPNPLTAKTFDKTFDTLEINGLRDLLSNIELEEGDAGLRFDA